MSRLRNRMVKAEFWTDPDLLAWPRDKRFFYLGMRSLCEDSGCMEDSPFGWMCVIYCSPRDRDISLEQVTVWRDELIDAGKLVRYAVAGKDYLFQTTFHEHEHPRNPQAPTLPLPSWVRWIKNDSDGRKGHYEVNQEALERIIGEPSSVEQQLYNDATTLPAQPRPAPPRPLNPSVDAGAPTGVVGTYPEVFSEWWVAYGRVGDKARAYDLYAWWVAKGAAPEDLLRAACNYRVHCERTDTKMKHATTFLAKPAKGKSPVWPEWAEDEPHGSMDARSDSRLSDVITAGAQAFGLTGGAHEHTTISKRPAGTVGRGADAGCGLPAGSVEE